MSDTPQSVPVLPTDTDNANETAAHGIESTGSQPVPVSSDGGQATVAGKRSSSASTTILQFLGDYAVIKKIGEGGMGAVYLAEDTKLQRKAAIKTMKPELAANPLDRERFLREARTAAAVDHDNIVPIWQIGEAADGTPFIAMPFLQGEMLDSRLKREAVSPLGLIVKVAREVADGLAAAHEKELIHRDIKPGNVWLEGNLSSKQLNEQIRRCKILDFGLARSVDKDDAQLTASGAILGTPAYMAPEQARGEKVDHRADLFSLGVMLYRMATGKLPFRGHNAMAVLIALTTETPTPIRELAPNLHPALADLIDRLMSKDPAGRPQSAAEVSATVRQIVKDLQAKKVSSPTTPAATTSLAAPAAPTPSTSQPVPVYVLPAPAPSPWEEVTEADAEEPIAHPPSPVKKSRALWYAIGGVLGLLLLGAALAVVIIRLETAEGTLVVEINDPDVEARIKNGKLVLIGKDGKEMYVLSPAAENTKKITAGTYLIRVEGMDGLVLDTKEFTLRKNGEIRVKVSIDPKLAKKVDPKKDDPVAKSDDPDRKAAEYVLTVGGKVRVNDEQKDIKDAKELPAGGFRLTAVNLVGNKQVNDEGLACFADCKNLTSLGLDGTKTGDAGLAHFKGCKGLTDLGLAHTQVSDAGMAHFKDCNGLRVIGLLGTKVSDAGLVHFGGYQNLIHVNLYYTSVGSAGLTHLRSCKKLVELGLGDSQVGDEGLAHLKDCTALQILSLSKTSVGDKGLAHLKDCKNLMALDVAATKVTNGGLAALKDCERLTTLYLTGTQITDDGLASLKGCKDLSFLWLDGTPVTDAGIEHLKECKSLKSLSVRDTKVTAKGIEGLTKALPGCRIIYDGGTIEPTVKLDPDRKAAEYVLALGGTVIVNYETKYIIDVKDLPKEPFRLVFAHLRDKPGVTDAGLAAFKGCKYLRDINLAGTGVTDVGLAHFADHDQLLAIDLSNTKVSDNGLANFKGCTDLRYLRLDHTQVGDAGMKHFAARKNLTFLGLHQTNVSDVGLASFADCPELTYLDIHGTTASDAGLLHFKNCKRLTSLGLGNTQVSDIGLAPFKDCKGLVLLQLQNTKVTPAKVTEFAKALPNCKIEHDGGVIEPAKK